MSLQACAQIVERADSDRFLSVMAAPATCRRALFALYAFNIEVTRAPWVTQEALIAEMRLQWWRDALEEMAQGAKVRAHEVTTELAAFLTPETAAMLDQLIEARRQDIPREPFADWDQFHRYLRDTSGLLMGVAARAIGTQGSLQAVIDYGGAAGLANWLRGYAQLKSQGGSGLPDDSPAALAEQARTALRKMRGLRGQMPRSAYPAIRASWSAARTLRSAADNPNAILDGALHNPEFVRRGALMWRVFTNTI